MKKKKIDLYNLILLILLVILIGAIILERLDIDLIIIAIPGILIFPGIFILSLIKIIYSIIKKNNKALIIPIISLIISIIGFVIVFISPGQTTIDKPIIYFYPEEKLNLNVSLDKANTLINTYPEYNNGWNIEVDESGNIYDLNTKRNYYALYYDALDKTKIDETIGFVVSKNDLVSFLEEKLELIGLNEREINEFIIYWLPKLNNNEYTYIHFRTTEEVNKNMPLNISETPDTLIRVYVDFKKTNKNKKTTPQDLIHTERNGFTVVEWGGRIL